jgi:hypothetical protein
MFVDAEYVLLGEGAVQQEDDRIADGQGRRRAQMIRAICYIVQTQEINQTTFINLLHSVG